MTWKKFQPRVVKGTDGGGGVSHARKNLREACRWVALGDIFGT